MDAAVEADSERLPFRTRLLYGLGDHTTYIAFAVIQFFYVKYLTDVAGVRTGMAGLIPLIGRAVDAFTDPAMGRISDRTRWRAGRRRPYLLIGMLPFGVTFALLFADTSSATHATKFWTYTSAYIGFSLAVTVLSVPYLSMIPEMTRSYHERTVINTWRAFLGIAGTLFGVLAFPPLVAWFGGGSTGYAIAANTLAVWLVLPWFVVWFVTFERPELRTNQETPGFLEGLGTLFEHSSYRWLTALYLLGRIALDLTSAMLIFYFSYWIGRPEDFKWMLGLFLVAVMFALPLWLAVSRYVDKRTIFILGAGFWVLAQVFLFLLTPEWPRWVLLVFAPLAGAGYAAADMIPWSMIGEVVDEDELRTGERREGLYYGFFTFIRKLAGAAGVAGAMLVLDLVGYRANQPQSDDVLLAIRVLTAAIPGAFVLVAGFVALGYRLTRERHEEILRELDARRRGA